ncbi:matrix metalloproteinase-2-like isoform X2 [Sitodiplosis mosellana]|uniref:matrix metalloproteinase-2-like isoform X2 n=1 Tax=Sitodiplosis mosellana TaxID=263140 RepID=UPI002443A339|nr:matrix metalloproteinase-2-like isoform X2 [Sitodiplosis mosellana]
MHRQCTGHLVNQTMADLDVGRVRQILSEALDVWSRGSRLTFQEVYSKDADIQVLFARRHHGDGYDFDGPGSVLAHAFYPGTGRGGDAHFDEEEKWILSPNEGDGTNLLGVAVHEFGHSLGLGHSSVESAIMFPWYHGYQKYKELPEDDRLAIQQIYGSRQKIWGDNPRPRLTTSASTTTSTTPRSYYPDRSPTDRDRDRQRERDERERQEAERDRERQRLERERQRQEWERKEWERRASEREQREKERRRQKEREQKERDEQEKRRQQSAWEREERERHRYDGQNTPSTTNKPWHHHNHHPKYNKNGQNHPNKEKPDTCNTSYDAITIIRNELFIFKDRYLWRIGDNGLHSGYPHEINRVWSQLPSNFTHIDAVYENKHRKIVFFMGKMYYVFNSNKLEDGYPKALTTLGLPATVDKIDAVLVWGHNNRTYFYSGTMYWRFDEDIHHVELDYPRDMSIWRGIGYHIDAAFQYKDGKTYFFKGKSFWQFNDSIMHVTRSRPDSSAVRWMGCPRVTSTYSNEVYDDGEQRKEPLVYSTATMNTVAANNVYILLISTIFVLWHF